ncbi:plexin domain-containing protein 2-like [Ostrinia furnacalis]|nr:plexin domain-containing protein 2-like [Ostrinia furnacalis]
MATPHAYRDFSFEMRMPFDFPFYGHYLKNITICTGGYVFTGPSNHRWYAQQQNISPLMANFDLTLDETSGIVLFEEADKVTIVWENMKLRERRNLKFTFAVTIYKNGDIYFAYKEVPMKIQSIGDRASVFIGLADSYFMNKVAFYVNRRTLHNYSRIPFYGYNITSGSVLQLIAQPSCPMYNTCEACVAHEEKYDSFKCIWCESLHKCTSGADFFRPYVADCDFDNKCSNNTEDNDTLPRLSFFHRIFNYAM